MDRMQKVLFVIGIVYAVRLLYLIELQALSEFSHFFC